MYLGPRIQLMNPLPFTWTPHTHTHSLLSYDRNTLEDHYRWQYNLTQAQALRSQIWWSSKPWLTVVVALIGGGKPLVADCTSAYPGLLKSCPPATTKLITACFSLIFSIFVFLPHFSSDTNSPSPIIYSIYNASPNSHPRGSCTK